MLLLLLLPLLLCCLLVMAAWLSLLQLQLATAGQRARLSVAASQEGRQSAGGPAAAAGGARPPRAAQSRGHRRPAAGATDSGEEQLLGVRAAECSKQVGQGAVSVRSGERSAGILGGSSAATAYPAVRADGVQEEEAPRGQHLQHVQRLGGQLQHEGRGLGVGGGGALAGVQWKC